jgi:hypothetical protein
VMDADMDIPDGKAERRCVRVGIHCFPRPVRFASRPI